MILTADLIRLQPPMNMKFSNNTMKKIWKTKNMQGMKSQKRTLGQKEEEKEMHKLTKMRKLENIAT
jgi:hypothetical protein